MSIKPVYLLLAAMAASVAHAAPDPLPDVPVGPISVDRRAAGDALRLLLAKSGTGIGLTWCGSDDEPARLRRQVGAANLQGRLPGLVEQLARVAGFRYGYDAATRVLVVYEGKCDWAALQATSGADRPPGAKTAQGAGKASGQAPGASTAQGSGAQDAIAAPAPDEPKQSWVMSAQHTVRATFGQWATQAGWHLDWAAPTDFHIAHGARYEGEFADAVTQAVSTLDKSGAPIRAELYAGNRVLRIVPWRK